MSSQHEDHEHAVAGTRSGALWKGAVHHIGKPHPDVTKARDRSLLKDIVTTHPEVKDLVTALRDARGTPEAETRAGELKQALLPLHYGITEEVAERLIAIASDPVARASSGSIRSV